MNKDKIIDIVSSISKSIILFLLDYVLTAKINIINYYKSFLNNNFILINAELYTDLNNSINVTKHFKMNVSDKIDKQLIQLLFIINNIPFNENNNIRLKLYFKFQQINYIIYFPYENNTINLSKISVDKELEESEYYLPYPIFNQEIMNNFRNDIVLPYYKTEKEKKVFYTLFHIESKDILLTYINNLHNEKLYEYFNLIKTPFNDFGILYNVPVKLEWILVENNINIETFKNLYFKFLSVYFCEKEYDIKEHYIKMDNNDLDKFFISTRMKEILFQ
jgi:hypothetical protein